ncbi:MAG: AraC family transcriptional regulator [Gemmatimonadetes bacterium]|nr:AraC family transcriptional regulator [Gemmatimonadota bacterium]MBL0178682.1 AraC family transcriptional regulator [Gemmatimonadota bacterium]
MSAGTLNWWQIVALIGAAQGVIVAMALATKRPRRTPNLLLAGAVLAFACHLATIIYYSANLVPRLPHLFGVTQPVPFLFGPLFYLYAVTASDQGRRLRRSDLWHALPFVAFLAWGLPVYLLPASQKIALFHAVLDGRLPIQAIAAGPLMLVSGVIYTAVTMLALQRHQRVVAENYSTLDRVNLNWLRGLALAYAMIWVSAVALGLAEPAGLSLPFSTDFLIAVGITLVIVGIGYWGLRQPEIFRFATAEHAIPVGVVAPATDAAPAPPRYERSGLAPREADELKGRLVALMERERPYRQPELTLGELAERLGTTPHRLSEVLNAQLTLSFYDFINGYRVREVQQRLVGPDGARYTYLALALEAGFASKSTFNAAFKKLTGLTPSEYRRAEGA